MAIIIFPLKPMQMKNVFEVFYALPYFLNFLV